MRTRPVKNDAHLAWGQQTAFPSSHKTPSRMKTDQRITGLKAPPLPPPSPGEVVLLQRPEGPTPSEPRACRKGKELGQRCARGRRRRRGSCRERQSGVREDPGQGSHPGSTVHVASTSPCEVTGDSLEMKIEAWASDMYSADDRPPQRCPHLNPGPGAWEGVPRCGHRAV